MKVPRALLALSVCALATWTGCSCRSERESPHVSSPNGRWKEAFVTVEYHPAFYKNSNHYPPSVLHALSIRDSDLNRSYVILVQRSEKEVSSEMFEDLRRMEYTLKYSPDDTALAASVDGGRAWALFDLKSLAHPTDDPFWCAHRTFPSLDPWPSMRALAIEVLAAVDAASPAFAVHRGPLAKEWPNTGVAGSKTTWDEEILGASRYACARREDEELRDAFLTAFLHPDHGYTRSETYECAGAMAAADPAVKTRLQEALAKASPNQASAIREALKASEPKAPAKPR